jgi:hypothetical protein
MSKAWILIILVIAVLIQVYGLINQPRVPAPTPATTFPPLPFRAFGSRRFAPRRSVDSIPTTVPTTGPTSVPTTSPTSVPTSGPTTGPTSGPTTVPTSGPTSVPTSGDQRLVTFKSIAKPDRLIQLSLDAKRVVMDGLEGAILYYQQTGEESFDVYFYVNGKFYEFKYENVPAVGVLIHKHRDYDTICVYKLVN